MNMNWDGSFGWSEVIIALATLLGPIFAVQIQKFLERRRTREQRQINIFTTLMATRATKLSPAHVEALNAIPVEFYGRSKSLKAINDAWKEYLMHLDVLTGSEAWSQKSLDLFINLLFRLSQHLGYKFDRVQLSRDIYYPKGHSELEQDHALIREGLRDLLSGNRALPMDVVRFPHLQESSPDGNEALGSSAVAARQTDGQSRGGPG